MKILIIGAGFGGLAAACLLAKAGHKVTVLEKNEQLGGRAGVLEGKGFRFDTGPSWYLMPEVFEKFFHDMGEEIEDYFELTRLQPSYRVTFKGLSQQVDIHGDVERDKETFEAMEPGAGKQLKKYLARSEYVYHTALEKFLYKNYDHLTDFLTPSLLRQAPRLSLFSSMERYVSKYFKDPRLQQIMQYPMVFLGTNPAKAPALYNLLSHVDFNQGVFYPQGGMYKVTQALEHIARKYGVKFERNCQVTKILTEAGRVTGVKAKNKTYKAEVVISNADPFHTESQLLSKAERDHSKRYWQRRTIAPSALLIYLGVNKQYPSLLHHNLLFSRDWQKNFEQIFRNPAFPDDPSFYVCAPSKTDPSVAPKGKENLFVLVPLAAGLTYSPDELEVYANRVLATMERKLKLPGLRKQIIYKKLFCVKDFEQRFNSFRGSGLGLAHTLNQTAIFRPSNRSRKVKNLYYVGANVHPGIGLPMTLISAELVAQRLVKPARD